jgi:hypothetical protein
MIEFGGLWRQQFQGRMVPFVHLTPFLVVVRIGN